MRLTFSFLVVLVATHCVSRPQVCDFSQLSAKVLDVAAHNPPAFGVVAGKVITSKEPDMYPAPSVRLRRVTSGEKLSAHFVLPDGEFAFYQVPTGERLVLEIESYGFQPQRSEEFVLSPGQQLALCSQLRAQRAEPLIVTSLGSR